MPPLAAAPHESDSFVIAEVPARAGESGAQCVDALWLAIELLSGNHHIDDRAVDLALEGRLVGGVAVLRIRETGDEALVVDAARFAAAGAGVEARVVAERTEEAVLDAVTGTDIAARDDVVVVDGEHCCEGGIRDGWDRNQGRRRRGQHGDESERSDGGTRE